MDCGNSCTDSGRHFTDQLMGTLTRSVERNRHGIKVYESDCYIIPQRSVFIIDFAPNTGKAVCVCSKNGSVQECEAMRQIAEE